MQWEDNGLRIGSRITTNSGLGNVYFTGGSDSVKMFINGSNGNVGIGTTSPSFKLDVTGDIALSNDLYVSNGNFIKLQRNSGGLYLDVLGTPSGTDDVRLLSSGDFNFVNGSLTNLLTIKNGGNVGIGTTSPGTKLHVEGSSAGAGIVLRVKNTGANGAAQLDLVNDAQSWFVNTRVDDKFSIYNNTASSTALTIDTSDNVGIGITRWGL